MRFLIKVTPDPAPEPAPRVAGDDDRDRTEQGWTVTVTCPDAVEAAGLAALEPRPMGAVAAGRAGRLPAPAGACPDEPGHELCRDGPDALREVYEEVVVRREPGDGTAIVRLGRYLFDALLGGEAWKAIRAAAEAAGARVIELALAWDPAEHALHRMPWELLHDGHVFLAWGSGRIDVTFTRLVASEQAVPRTLDRPPRLLFAIGAALNDPEVRPGAEAVGLLTDLEDGSRTVHARILEHASPGRLRRWVEEFRPDAVHLIGHGRVTQGGEAVLELLSDDPGPVPGKPAPEPCDGAKLLQLLRTSGGDLPQLVVLSACHSGPTVRLLGGHETAPLSVQLVQGGVPVVVGMAGQVSDLAARLFARAFGHALLGGASLVEASAEARRVGLVKGEGAARSVDWALPAVFMAASVDPDWHPVGLLADRDTRLVDGWISQYHVSAAPVFCGRTEFLDAFWRMLHPDGRTRPVLIVSAKGQAAGLGRTRLLKELTRQALRCGHVPLLLGADGEDSSPRTLPDFRRLLATRITQVRGWMELPPAGPSQLNLLARFDRERVVDDGLAWQIRDLLDLHGEVTPEVARVAVEADLGRLAADARARHPQVANAGGRAVLLLDGVDDNSEDLLRVLYDEILGDHGLGTHDEPVPVVIAMTSSDQANLLRDLAEGHTDKPWLDVRTLRPFQGDGEDLLAYQQVMLHPFRKEPAGIADVPWVFNRALEEPLWNAYVAAIRGIFGGRPSVFVGQFFDILWVVQVGKDPFVKKADDWDLIKRFREGLQQP